MKDRLLLRVRWKKEVQTCVCEGLYGFIPTGKKTKAVCQRQGLPLTGVHKGETSKQSLWRVIATDNVAQRAKKEYMPWLKVKRQKRRQHIQATLAAMETGKRCTAA